jgi:translation initiation factor 2B subunit (eIF-2B alpha/beta/delta family)
MTDDLRARVREVAGDRTSGASTLLPAVVSILREARAQGEASLEEAASSLCNAQPSMGGIWNAALSALTSTAEDDRLGLFAQRAARATASLTRHAVTLLSGDPSRPPRLVTHSASGTVVAVVRALAGIDAVEVDCTEGRPVFEGRQMAAALAEAGAVVRLWTDAGVQQAIPGAGALLLGADALSAGAFINKTGSSGMAAAASLLGVPVYVLATRDKFVPRFVAARLRLHEREPREVWDEAPAGIVVRNRYFEWTPLAWVTAVVTDAGVVGPDDVEEVCRGNERGVTEAIVGRIRLG